MIAAVAAAVLGGTLLAVTPGPTTAAPSPGSQASGTQAGPQAVRLQDVGAGLRVSELALPDDPAARAAPGAGTAAASSRTFDTDGFTMVAATWPGAGRAQLRFRLRAGERWGKWQELPTLADGRPTSGGATSLLWVGEQQQIQVDSRGPVPEGTRVLLTDTSGATNTPAARAKERTAEQRSAKQRTARPRSAPRPRIRGRKAWGANEKWREDDPTFGRRIKQVHVHHTANSNKYRRRDVPGILRGIYRYHTKSLGWSDIGYNVLVDRFGRAWVGRHGGIAQRVQGAHTLGFNRNSTGIAVIGNFETAKPSRAVRVTIARVAAWLLDREGRRASGQVRRVSRGSDRYRSGRRVSLPVIDGHRDTNDTACPGLHLYAALPQIRRVAQARIERF